jgi:putative transcriptional regulator
MKGTFMARSYNKLWHLLIDKKMSRTQLRKKVGMTTNKLAKLGRDESVPLVILERICVELECKFDDIWEYIPDKEKSKLRS